MHSVHAMCHLPYAMTANVIPWWLLVVAMSASPGAQVVKSDGPKPQFEVVTVRPNKSGEQNASMGARPGGRMIATNQTVRNLIRNAFNVQPFQLIGGPDWLDTDRFDIQAKAADADVDEKGMLSMSGFMLRLQALLEDRFRMIARSETRELPVYALMVDSPGKLGPKLTPHKGDCHTRPPTAGPPPPGSINCGTRATPGKVTGSGITIQTFVRNLAGATGRYVIDRTGLEGAFDLELEFTPDHAPDTSGPSLFTAMQEQLGLKLDATRAPVEVIVIDKVERPTPD